MGRVSHPGPGSCDEFRSALDVILSVVEASDPPALTLRRWMGHHSETGVHFTVIGDVRESCVSPFGNCGRSEIQLVWTDG
ncbi:MAG: hypothetical protein CM1200mP26_13810 [Acidimicrobiales bacterium]|nr:MAG: hypothetical protein CM1200mP26_13810 [Acidimicrobiales bacterium]